MIMLTRFKQREEGLTLIELVVVLVLIGIIFPTFFSLAGMASVKAAKFLRSQQAQYLAESKMEEIIGFRKLNWDWYKSIEKFEKTETLDDDFTRSVKVEKIKNWGKAQIEGWQVTVTVSHPVLEENVTLSIRFSKYYEIKE
ncbi:prepilin-type N-terminal cleavage/methylation domain-containing protein [Caldithrix abyssi]|nr:prepilin-type N-terminal cleavage/methylation domain-containing protein [Caldithrix abyssi]